MFKHKPDNKVCTTNFSRAISKVLHQILIKILFMIRRYFVEVLIQIFNTPRSNINNNNTIGGMFIPVQYLFFHNSLLTASKYNTTLRIQKNIEIIVAPIVE